MSANHRRYIALSAAIFAACAAIASCGRESPTSILSSSSWARLERYVLVIDDDSPVMLEYVEDSTYVFSIVDYPPEIGAGDILIGSDGEGYVRAVTGIESDVRRLYIHTTRALLTDAVISGGAEFNSYVGFGSEQAMGTKNAIELAPGFALAGGGVGLSGIVLYEGEIEGQTASIRIDEGYVEFNPEVTIGLGIAAHRVERFRCSTEGTLSYRFDVAVDIPAEFTTHGEAHIATARSRVVRWMGPVPITVKLALELFLAWEFSGSYAGDCATALAGDYALAAGAAFSAGFWSDIGMLEPSLSADPLRCIEYAETGGFRLAITPRLSVELFGEAAAFTQSSAETGFTAHTSSPPIWEWSIDATYSDSCLLRPESLGAAPGSYSTNASHYSATVLTGPFRTDSYIFELLWGREGTGAGEFSYPRGAAMDTEGNIYVVDSWNSRIQKFAADSTFIVKWGREGTGEGQFLMPADIAVDGAGNIYVTDSGNNRIQKFAPDTSLVTSWGSRGSGEGEFESPTGIAVGPDGNIYVVDTGNHRVQKFTPAGSYLTEWGEYGSGPGQFDTPHGIAADDSGNIYVTECRNNRVQKFSNDGLYLLSWGSFGTADGEFDCPIAVAVDREGGVYIADYGNDRFQKFTSSGDLATLLGSGGTGEGEFDRPEGISVAQTGVIFIVDSRNSRVQKFAPLQ